MKRRHIGLFATNLINAIRGGVRSIQGNNSRRKYITHNLPNQRPPTSPMGKYPTYSKAIQNTQFRLFPQQTPGPEHVQHQQPAFRREQQQTPVPEYVQHQQPAFRREQQQTPGPEYVQHQQPTFRREQLSSFPHENREHEQTSYNLNSNKDAIPNEIISFLRFIKSYI